MLFLVPGFRRDDVWIPAFAGMTGWRTFLRVRQGSSLYSHVGRGNKPAISVILLIICSHSMAMMWTP